MSRTHRKNLSRGIKHPLGEREQRVRTSRHGKPQTKRRWFREIVEVPAGTPGAIRSVEEVNGELAVIHRLTRDRAGQVPVTEAFKVRVASGPTGKVGLLNITPQQRKVGVSDRPSWWSGR